MELHRDILGGRGETRTHTPISEPSVFKTAAARPTRLTLPNFWWVLKELNLTANHPTYYGNGFTVRRREYDPNFGAQGRIQTYGFTALQAVALGHSATCAL